MPKNPAAHRATGHRGANAVYGEPAHDDRVVGMGTPPSDPEWQAANPGAGRLVMQRELVEVEDLPGPGRPPEDKWILKPSGERTGIPINLEE